MDDDMDLIDEVLSSKTSHTIKTYQIYSQGEDIDYGQLINGLRDVNETSTEEVDDDTIVPEPFESDGKLIYRTQVTTVRDIGERIIGRGWLEYPHKYDYRDRKIAIIESYKVTFLIHEIRDEYYLNIISSREKADDFIGKINQTMGEFGFRIFELKINQDDLKEVIEEMDGEYIDSRVVDIDQHLKSLEATGKGHQESDKYKEIVKNGTLNNCMFSTNILHKGEDRYTVMLISTDLLSRCYTSETYDNHLKLIKKYILPYSERKEMVGSEDFSKSDTLSGYDDS